jgi:hypothetical protein
LCGKGDDFFLRNFAVLSVALTFLGMGAYDILKQKRTIGVLDEIVRFLNFIKGEIHYRTPAIDSLIDYAKKQKYKYIDFENTNIILNESVDLWVKDEFSGFVNRIGTTDTAGQLALCDEYISRFSEKLSESKQNEKSKIQVKAALSVMGALCVIILFI